MPLFWLIWLLLSLWWLLLIIIYLFFAMPIYFFTAITCLCWFNIHFKLKSSTACPGMLSYIFLKHRHLGAATGVQGNSLHSSSHHTMCNGCLLDVKMQYFSSHHIHTVSGSFPGAEGPPAALPFAAGGLGVGFWYIRSAASHKGQALGGGPSTGREWNIWGEIVKYWHVFKFFWSLG